ncbi:MAG TPA: VWA domain-containing protein [Longimicrobiales bacterium]|nr:VWA domain-containing protein [Longimicrobiales bacterium]
MTFSDRDLLLLALIVPVLLFFLLVRYTQRRRRVGRVLGEEKLLARLGGGGLQRIPVERFALLIPAAIALGVAASGPQWGLQAVEGSSSSVNVVLALDISKSMLARDVSPNRLERERIIVRRLLRDLRDARIGMVVFAGRAYILAPLTNDQSALQLFVDALDPDIVSQGGSSLASALVQAANLARGPEGAAGERAVVLITDGEAHESEQEIEEAAERAQRSRVKIFTVAVGTERGAPVPEVDPESGRIIGYKKDPFGETVVSRSNPDLLRDIARSTGGTFYDASAGASTGNLIRQLRNLERSPGASEEGLEPRDQTVWFIAIALLLLLLDFILARRARTLPTLRELTPPQRAAASIILLLAFGTGWSIGDVEKANRLYRAGKYEEAARIYQEVIRSGKVEPYVRYNLGTALLRLGRYQEAQQHLQQATREAEAELKQRAQYNLGNRYLEEARKGEAGEQTTQLLDAAIESYKHALRLDPGDMDAKWNLELALREREKQSQSPSGGANEQRPQTQSEEDQSPAAGGQGGGQSQSQQPTGRGSNRGQNYEQRPMSQEEADRVLSAVEQDERELTREKLKKGQRRTPVARDW